MAISPKVIETLSTHRQQVRAGGGADKLEARHRKGLLGARERLAVLFDADTFQEGGAYVRHCGTHFGMEARELPADGVISGTGFVDGMQVAAFSQDFTVAAGTLGKMHARKIVDVMRVALKNGTPLVAF
ncbi:MAG: carboxyl transferase domain-containing protein, partial [Azonexus sp.]